jgi:hypothetical protein
MSTMHLASVQYPTTTALRRWTIPGLTAGAAFLAIELVAGAANTSVFRFPEAIAETIGVASSWSLLAGLIIHFTFSLGLGALFIGAANRLQLSGAKLLAAGVLFMWIESGVSIWLVLHTLFPTTLPILFAAVPVWASVLGRTTFGAVLAATYARVWR